jgi:hypothetical protein
MVKEQSMLEDTPDDFTDPYLDEFDPEDQEWDDDDFENSAPDYSDFGG